jgi:hypothetical protein
MRIEQVGGEKLLSVCLEAETDLANRNRSIKGQ